jgi:para-nitrobenzyl esterase
VRDAIEFGPSCMQAEKKAASEDCLTVNVWRPLKPSPEPLPVMFWLHGGALVRGGTALYPGAALAAQGVVFVSANYRLGRLGFFAHPALAAEAPGELRGNYGYMDQLAALEWVQHNVAAFGGDPRSVTMFGESAGGGSVLVHMISPLSRGLFQRAILQSPGAPTARARVTPIAELDVAEKVATEYARSLGIAGDDMAALQALRALPAAKLVEGTSGPEVLTALSTGTLMPGFASAIRDGRQIVEVPEVALAAGHQAMVPLVVGANDRELALGVAASKEELFANFGPYAADARTLYDPGGDRSLDELKQQAFADRLMVEPARHLADEAARAGQPTWLYRFSYVADAARGNTQGAAHGMEIPYVFDLPASVVGNNVAPADRALAATTSAYWVAFAKTGDPNGGGRPQWPRHDAKSDRIIDFANRGVVVRPDPLRARLDLWQRVWQEARRGG